jgi:TetR/AcrR family transcriptional regulator, tetracycline repressor protein
MSAVSSVSGPRKSGTTRAARGTLTRAGLIASGLALIDRSGADALTMRGLADAVGVSPMALYNHFSSKHAFLLAVAESVIGAAEFDGRKSNWRDQIHHCFAVLRSLCLQHPGLPRLLEMDGAAPATVFAPMEVTLRALRTAGLDDIDSLRTYFVLVGYTLTQASYQKRPIPALEPSEQVRAERIAGRGYDAIENLKLPAEWDFDASFVFGISLILDGVKFAVAKAPHTRRRVT